ncbi:MAG: DUF45 domain-containing protein [Bacillota bacterium]|nr:DUF45 domain-containing protein [Bacillota bacterium]MDI3317530.1 DUF45 domain-containing protein [Bacillota bacterium]
MKPGTPRSRELTLDVDGTRLHVVIQRKAVKNVNARLAGSELRVSAPAAVPDDVLEPVVRDLARKLLRRVEARRINGQTDALALARRVAARFPEPPAVRQVLFVTTQSARWGSYSAATRTVRLNAILLRMPSWVLESVVAHELAHVFHLDHSPAFRELLRRVDPRADEAHAFLAGVSWLARSWGSLPAAERRRLAGMAPGEGEGRGLSGGADTGAS